LIDAFHRNHEVTFLCDASASHALDELSADDVHRTVSRISGLYGKYMKPPTGSPPLSLASSVAEKTPVANSEEKLHAIRATLEQCRSALIEGGDRETALLVSVAVLELRMKLHRIEDAELKALCDAMVSGEVPVQAAQEPKSPQGQGPRRRPLLKLVK
jgi:hypothetical protein